MKRIIAIFIMIVLFLISGCNSYSINKDKINTEVIQGNTEFAFDIFKELNRKDSDKNIFISPLSISTVLTMTYEGSGGTTKEEMAKTLKYKGIDLGILNESYKNLLAYLKNCDSKVKLNINNSIWVREGNNVKSDFIRVNKDIFNANTTELDFSKKESADVINKWINDSTNGKIQKMIDPPIDDNVIMYLINAIYFKGNWAKEFDKKKTFLSEFHGEDGNTQGVNMMVKKGTVEYGQGDNFKAVRLPYGKGKTSMYCILPKGNILVNDFIEAMNFKKWEEIKKSVSKKEDILLHIPRFNIEYGIKELNGALCNLGMSEAFSMRADFKGICDDIRLSRVLHKAVIEVNEEGTKAAGVTVVEMKNTSTKEPLSFIVNRPFIFVIAEEETGTILFIGKVKDIPKE